MLRRAAYVAVGIAVVVACGSDYDSQDGNGADAGTDAPVAIVPGTSGTPGTSGGPPPDFEETDDIACTGRAPDDTFDVYVSATTGVDGADCGSRDAACKTVQAGVARAYALGKPKVVIAKGTYVESVTLDGGLILEGGWEVSGTTWTASCNADHSSLAVLEATTDTTVKATRGASVLRFLTLRSKDAAGPGESLYGLVATGSGVKVALADSAIVVAAGGAGAAGTANTALADTPADCSPADGGAGANGESGDAGGLGTITPAGFAATTAAPGFPGNHGQSGKPVADQVLTYKLCHWTGGGQGSGTCNGIEKQQRIDAGAAGCGGRAGLGGQGGAGGGSSIGILAIDAQIVTYGGSVTTGGGGAGGAGGKGADGTAGAAGGPGVTFRSSSGATTGSCSGNSRASCEDTDPVVVTGPSGSGGGAGGTGGTGGGGAGGWSIGFVKLGNSAVLASTTTEFKTGDAGAGGAPNGVAGLRQQQWPP